MQEVTEDITKNEVTWTTTGGTGRRVFYVTARSQDEAKGKPGVPQEGHLFQNKLGQILNPFLVALSIRANVRTPSAVGGTSLFIVEIEYGVPSAGTTKQPKPGGPAIPSWKTIKERVPTDVALQDRNPGATRDLPITYANGDVVDPAVSALRVRAELTLRWVAQSFGYLQYLHFITSVNLAPFYGAPAERAQIIDLDEQPRDDGYLNCSMVVEIYDNPFDLRHAILDIEAGQVRVFDSYYLRNWTIPIPGI